MKIGFDIDGTISESWSGDNIHFLKKNILGPIMLFFLSHSNEHKCVRWLIKRYVLKAPALMVPVAPAYFITSRPLWLFATTFNWMSQHGVKPKALLMAHWHRNDDECEEKAAEKAWAIKKLDLDIYYEDELEMRKRLTWLCPYTEILKPEVAIKRGHAVWEEDS